MAVHRLFSIGRRTFSIQTSISPLCSIFLPNISSSPFSSLCRPHFSLPSHTPPVPKKVPFIVSSHGRTRLDPFRWMSDTNDPDLAEYLARENSYADAFMVDTKNLQRAMFSEMASRIPAQISTPPERWGSWLYYQYIPEGKEYPVLCRILETKDSGWLKSLLQFAKGNSGREQILLDWNEIAKQYGYVHVGTCRVSPDCHFLAYTVDITGSEHFMLQIKDLRSGFVIQKSQRERVVSLAWAREGRMLFYTQSDENQRPYRVYCTEVGGCDIEDVLVFEESDSTVCVDITSTKDGKFITININSRTSSEVYIIDSSNPLGGLQRINKRVPGVQYFLEHHNGLFYILTNAPLGKLNRHSGEGYYLARCRVEDISTADWQDIILPSEHLSFQDLDIFNGHLVLFVNKNNVPMLCSINLPLNISYKSQIEIQNLNPWYFPLPPSSCSIVPSSNHDFMGSLYRVVLSSPVMPDVVVDYDMSRQTFSIVQQEEVMGAFPNKKYSLSHNDNEQVQLESQMWNSLSNAYCCERKDVVSRDGTKIPLTLLYSRLSWQKAQSPGLLKGYGAYGEVLDKSWCSHRLSLLDRGFLVALADVRGGGGGDSSWHKTGSGLCKQNSVDDFVSCANYLINEGYVHKDRLASIGYSAGCLLVGAAINMYPNLFSAAILKVPFLDICNTLSDPSLPLTVLDYEEFGNPMIQNQFEYILSYSPYDNISPAKCYPPMLVQASFLDSRVGVWEAAKWVAKIRDETCSRCSRSTILKTNMVGGHFGEGGRHGQCEEMAYDYAFIIKAMGISEENYEQNRPRDSEGNFI